MQILHDVPPTFIAKCLHSFRAQGSSASCFLVQQPEFPYREGGVCGSDYQAHRPDFGPICCHPSPAFR